MFLLPPYQWLEYSPGGFPLQVIDSWACSGCEDVTSAGAEPPPLSAHHSRGWLLLYVTTKRSMYTSFLLFTWCLHSHFVCVSGPLCWAAALLGLRSLFCCHEHFRWPLIPQSGDSTSTCWNAEHHIYASLLCQSCLAGGSVTVMSVRSHHSCHCHQVCLLNCNWHKMAVVYHKMQLPLLFNYSP